jgi:hypothetical protein
MDVRNIREDEWCALVAAARPASANAHCPYSRFAVGKIGVDQLADFASRAGRTLDEARRRLAPNL